MEQQQQYLTVQEVSQYLHIKPGTLYAKAETDEIPHYKIGRLVRFKKADIDAWMEKHRRGSPGETGEGDQFQIDSRGKPIDVDRIIKKVIAETKNIEYTPKQGRPDQTRGPRKEVEHGSLS